MPRKTRVAIAILAQGARALTKQPSERPSSTSYSSCMQQKGEEPDPLFYKLPLPRLLNWNRWWHIVAKTAQLVLRKKTWAAIGHFSSTRKGVILRVLYVSESSGIARVGSLSALSTCPTRSWSAPRHRYRHDRVEHGSSYCR